MSENFGNHRGIFNRGNDLQGATTVRAMLNVDIEYAFEQPGPAHVGRSRLMGGLVKIIGYAGRSVWDDLRAQFCE